MFPEAARAACDGQEDGNGRRKKSFELKPREEDPREEEGISNRQLYPTFIPPLTPSRGSEGTHNGSEGFVDPFIEDRRVYFRIASDGSIRALQPPASYMIRLLRLDREFLRKLRQLRILKHAWRQRVAELRRKAESGELPEPTELARICAAIEALLH
jgi:hypothetical protein